MKIRIDWLTRLRTAHAAADPVRRRFACPTSSKTPAVPKRRHAIVLLVWRIPLVVVLSLAAGCASSGPKPGVGDISFRLLWTGESDLDLYVTSPVGERIDFVRRSSESGGMLDVDCNVQTVIETNLCSEPMENIFWPRGAAPEGEYRFWAVIADPRGLKEEDVFKVEVRKGRTVVRQEIGRIVDLRSEPPIWTLEYPGEE